MYGLVAVVTGRSSDVAQAIVGVSGLRYAGEHGLELDAPRAAWADPIHAFARDAAWPDTELKPLSAAFHYRAAAEPEVARAQLEPVATAAVGLGSASALRPHGARDTAAARRNERHRSPSAARRGGPAAGAVCRRRRDRPGTASKRSTVSRSRCASQSLPTKARRAGSLAQTSSSSHRPPFSSCSAALELEPLAQLARLPARDVELGLPGVGELQADAVGRRPAHGGDLREVDEVRAVDAREARAEAFLELAEGRRAEVRAVVGVHAAVVPVRLHVVHLADVEQLRSAGGDDGDLLDGSGVLARALAKPLENASEPIRVDRLEQVVERLDRESVDRVLARAR